MPGNPAASRRTPGSCERCGYRRRHRPALPHRGEERTERRLRATPASVCDALLGGALAAEMHRGDLVADDLGEVNDGLAARDRLRTALMRHLGRHRPPPEHAAVERQDAIGPARPGPLLWVTTTTAVPLSARRSGSSSCIRLAGGGSRLPVGSSASSTAGSGHQRPGQRHPLLLAAGEHRDARTDARDARPTCVQRLGGAMPRRRPRRPRRSAAASSRSRSGREVPQQVMELEDEAEAPIAQRGQGDRVERRIRDALRGGSRRRRGGRARRAGAAACSCPAPLAPTIATNSPGATASVGAVEHRDRRPVAAGESADQSVRLRGLPSFRPDRLHRLQRATPDRDGRIVARTATSRLAPDHHQPRRRASTCTGSRSMK